MEFTINCTRVPLQQGTTLYGIPVEEGLAPDFSGSVSEHASSDDFNDGTALNLPRRVVPDRLESVPTPNKHLINCKNTTIISSFNRLSALLAAWRNCPTAQNHNKLTSLLFKNIGFIIPMICLNIIKQIRTNLLHPPHGRILPMLQ